MTMLCWRIIGGIDDMGEKEVCILDCVYDAGITREVWPIMVLLEDSVRLHWGNPQTYVVYYLSTLVSLPSYLISNRFGIR